MKQVIYSGKKEFFGERKTDVNTGSKSLILTQIIQILENVHKNSHI